MNKHDIINLAKDIGIDIIGFSSAQKFTDSKKIILDRIEKGFDSKFNNCLIEERVNPRILMEDIKSIISIAVPYASKYNHGYNTKDGLISMSSWGNDYHKVLKAKLNSLCESISRVYKDFKYKILVDTSSLDDRSAAFYCGLGFFGKNNCIITKEYGSFVFLGEILTNLEFSSADTMDSLCGDCKRCIEACPTNALKEDNVMDTNVCISYLTQCKEIIPDYLKEKMSNKIYGCDTCQVVCPFNKIDYEPDNKFLSEGNEKIDLIKILNLTNREYKEIYGHKALAWRSKNVIVRNAIIACANLNYKEALPYIENIYKNSTTDWVIDACTYALKKLKKEV